VVSDRQLKYGARVYRLDDGVFDVKQTILRGGKYVIDGQRERHVDPGDMAALGAAVADACDGSLSAGKG
jgi:hypothetical protein